MTKTWFEQGMEKGEEKGVEKERTRWLHVIRAQLEQRFGTLTEAARQRLDGLDAEQLEYLAMSLVEADSLKGLGLED